MLQTLRLGPTRVANSAVLPSFLSPLVRAAEFGTDLVPEIELITRHFGFDSFTYRITTSPNPGQENQIFEFTTLPAMWAIRYDQKTYVEVDPRVVGTLDRTVPMLWDQSIERTNDTKLDAFLDDALSEGIASGVCVPLYDEVGTKIIVDFGSPVRNLEREREAEIHRSLGDIFIFARYFNEMFKRAAIERKISARNVGMPISLRERDCLTLAGQGVEIGEIGRRLRIDVRLVQIHFDSVRSKLGVANLRDAIARAVEDGIFSR